MDAEVDLRSFKKPSWFTWDWTVQEIRNRVTIDDGDAVLLNASVYVWFLLTEWRVLCCTYTASSFEVKTGATRNDVTKQPRLYTCTVCEKQYTCKSNLRRHQRTHTADNWYSCSQCEKRFQGRASLRLHMNVHSGKYMCTECGKCFQHGHHLMTHGLSHSGEKPYECSVCGKRFTTLGLLAVHSRTHSGEKPYKCHVCDKAFSKSACLNRHMTVHTREKPHKCSLCDRSFSRSDHLQTHRRHVHSSRRPDLQSDSHHGSDAVHQCHYCGQQFQFSKQLTHHVRIHTDAKPYSCRHCSDSFTWRSQLMVHLLKSHNEGSWFLCDICQKKFVTRYDRNMHSYRHADVKPYVCCECPKSFCTASRLNSHQVVHSDYKRFCCCLCCKYFKRKQTFAAHFKKCCKKLRCCPSSFASEPLANDNSTPSNWWYCVNAFYV